MSEKKLLDAGTYTTRVKNFHADLNSNGKPYAVVYFENGARYQGYFVGGAAEWTTNNLIAAGFKGTNPNDLNGPNALDKNKDIEIVVNHEKGQDGKVRAVVAFINKPYEQKEIDASSVAVLKGINLRGYMQEAGVKPGEQKAASNEMFNQAPPHTDTDYNVSTDAAFTSDDIPF